MRNVIIPANYYQQFDADYTLDVPSEGYGGWQKADLEFDLDRTAVVLMHACYYGPREEVPGVYNTYTYAWRSQEIGNNVMPGLLAAIRAAGIKLIYVTDESKAKNFDTYEETRTLPKIRVPRIEENEGINKLRKFRSDYSIHGKHNNPSFEISYAKYCKIPETQKPQKGDFAVVDELQLFELCKKYGLAHLIYIGYNIDWCILFAPGGIFHISRYGLMCSAIRQAVTACENKESARNEWSKEIALWQIGTGFGFVYDLDDFLGAIKKLQ